MQGGGCLGGSAPVIVVIVHSLPYSHPSPLHASADLLNVLGRRFQVQMVDFAGTQQAGLQQTQDHTGLVTLVGGV